MRLASVAADLAQTLQLAHQQARVLERNVPRQYELHAVGAVAIQCLLMNVPVQTSPKLALHGWVEPPQRRTTGDWLVAIPFRIFGVRYCTTLGSNFGNGAMSSPSGSRTSKPGCVWAYAWYVRAYWRASSHVATEVIPKAFASSGYVRSFRAIAERM